MTARLLTVSPSLARCDKLQREGKFYALLRKPLRLAPSRALRGIYVRSDVCVNLFADCLPTIGSAGSVSMDSDVFVTVKKVKSGDERAFSELCEKYSALVSVSADKYCRMLPENSNATPEDFEQEAYLALYRAAVTYDTDQTDVTFGLYAKTCIRNALISLLRKFRRTPKLVSDKRAPAALSDPLSGIISDENAEALLKMLSGVLSDYEYKMLMLYADGKTPRRIAQETGQSAKSVSNALFRARTKLKELYEDQK